MMPGSCMDIDECMEGIPACFKCTNLPGRYVMKIVTFLSFKRIRDKNVWLWIIYCNAMKWRTTLARQTCSWYSGTPNCADEKWLWVNHRTAVPYLIRDRAVSEWFHGLWLVWRMHCPSPFFYFNTNMFICIDLDSYKCDCDPGFVPNVNKTVCLDVNECDTNNGGCGQHTCINSFGTYRCECQRGYVLDPT